jgi:hypothetical protein
MRGGGETTATFERMYGYRGNPLKGKCKAIKGTMQENKEKRTREKTGERDKRRKQREIREQVERAP